MPVKISPSLTISALLVFSLLLMINPQVQAKTGRAKLTAVYLFRLAENIQWTNKAKIQRYRLHLIDSSSKIQNQLSDIAKIKKGLDWKFQQNLTFNIHYRGWNRIFSKHSTQPTFKRFGVYHYLDLNLSSQLHANKGPKFSVYIKNLFDNDDPIPGGVNSGQVEPQNGRQIGLRVGYQF